MVSMVFLAEKKINEVMGMFDMNDGNRKLFGFIVSLGYEGEMTEERLKKLIAEFEKEYIVGYAIFDNVNWINEKYWAFSDGQRFIFKTDLEKKIKTNEEIGIVKC